MSVPYLDYTRKTSFDSTSEDSSDADYSERHSLSYIDEEEEGASGLIKANDTDSESDSEDDLISQIVSQKSPTRITIKLHVTDKISSSWDSVSAQYKCLKNFIIKLIFPNFFLNRFWIMTQTSCMLHYQNISHMKQASNHSYHSLNSLKKNWIVMELSCAFAKIAQTVQIW